jgi:hypothetical protein
MNLSNWKIYNKSGSPLNWTPDPYLPLSFSADSSSAGAEGYLITDASGIVTSAKIIKSGFYYSDPTSVFYTYVLDGTDTSYDITSDVSVNYVDVSIFNPNPINTQGIDNLSNIDVSGNFVYPSVTYTAAIYLQPVSQGLVETEHLFIFEDLNGSLIRPYDTSTSRVVFEMVGDDTEISFFVVDDDTQEITWTDVLQYDLDVLAPSTPLTLNIGFRSEEEGVYERRLRVYNVIDEVFYLMGEIVVNAESIGEDERFRALLANFGAPDPKDIPRIFKEADINEALPDFKIINPKSKYMILEYSNIIPFIGTYKGLINAVKWLGYDDIYFREWFKNVKEDKKISLIVPYDAKDRTQTILKFSPDERKTLKKLNQLSLNYCITRETGEIDEWGTPETENCFEYNLQEVFIKLLALKQWLERNIIGVNARIIDLTGEGIYFERYINLIYSTGNRGFEYKDDQSLSPYTDPTNSELILGEASINMKLKEFSQTRIEDLNYRIGDFIDYIWDPNDPSTILSPLDPSYLADPSAYLEVGPPLGFPFVSLRDVQWKASLEQPDSGVISSSYVTNPLWIYDNEIKFYNIFDSSSVFIDSSVNLDILLEKAYIIDASGNDWINDNHYFVYEDPSLDGGYVLESSTGVIYNYSDFVYLNTDTSALLQYAVSETYRRPLLSFKNFKSDDASDNSIPFEQDKLYFLDILDGKIVMNTIDSSLDKDIIYYINFSYDYSTFEQKITLNVEYYSNRIPLYVVDPSIYYWADPSHLSGGSDPSSLAIDNSTYTMSVNHIGNYNVEVFAWDSYNIMFTNPTRKQHNVWIKNATIYNVLGNKIKKSYADASISYIDISTLLFDNKYPIFDRRYPYLGLTLEEDSSGNVYVNAPNATYFDSLPTNDSINRFFTNTEKVTNIAGNTITVDKRYEDFLDGDDITLIKTYKGNYLSIEEASSNIVGVFGSDLTLDQIPSNFVLDTSHNIFILNDTLRATSNSYNSWDVSTFTTDVSNYTFIENQIVDLVVTDACSGLTWGSSYRVLDVSGNEHIFDGLLPQFIVDASDRYSINAKHAFSSFVNYEIDTSVAIEDNNDFQVYLDKDYRQFFIDNTLVMLNIPFSHEYAMDQWYDPCTYTLREVYYYHDKPIEIDTSTMVIITSEYDSSNYMLNQKNIYTIKKNISKEIVLRVHNEILPFTFDSTGYYDVIAESYDSFGNLSSKTYEGLIKVS